MAGLAGLAAAGWGRAAAAGGPQALVTGGGFYFTTLSEESPRAFEFRGILTPESCAEVLAAAKARRERGPDVARLLPGHVPALKKLEEDLALWIKVPPSFAEEPFYAVELGAGGGQEKPYLPDVAYYEPWEEGDSWKPLVVDESRWGVPMATVIIPLTAPPAQGGELLLVGVDPNSGGGGPERTAKVCGKQGLVSAPGKGDALLYFSAGMDGLMDDWAQLEVCPVREGSGWFLIKRFYTRSGRRSDAEH